MSIAEVRQLIAAVQTPHNRAFFVTTYALGLRLQEALHLQVGDIDSRRMLGTVVYRCQQCHRTHSMGRSCGNRHCPTCQQHKTKAWLEDQTSRLLPCPYFLLTFTVPASLRRFVRSNQRKCYAAMFRASSETIRKLAADPKYLGSPKCGFFGVLHSWGRTLEYHPHVHYVVPGRAISEDETKWLSSRADFFIPVKAASLIYRAKFCDEMRQAGLLNQIPASVWREAWVVHSKAVGDGRRSLQYLAPYVFRVAISDRRIVSIEDGPNGAGQVTFAYRQSGSNRWRKMTVTAEEFLRRFLQHVLPTGFQKVRHYGFAAAANRKDYDLVRWLVAVAIGLLYILAAQTAAAEKVLPVVRCAECGAPMYVAAIHGITLTPVDDAMSLHRTPRSLSKRTTTRDHRGCARRSENHTTTTMTPRESRSIIARLDASSIAGDQRIALIAVASILH